MTQTALVYTRFSPRRIRKGSKEATQAAEDHASIKTQDDACRRYCAFANLEVARVIVDPLTSAGMPLKDRPGGAELYQLTSGKRPQYVHIVAATLDRMFRNEIDGLSMMDEWAARGVKLHLANQAGVSLDVSTANGRLCATMLLGVTTWERKNTGERTSRGMKFRQRNGEIMGSRPPYGWKREGGKLVPNRDEYDIMASIVRAAERGDLPAEIAKILNFRKFSTRSGKPWKAVYVRRILARQVAKNSA